MLRFTLISALLVLGVVASAQSIYFVNAAAVGNNDGSSWQNAYTSLQTALTTAASGDQIWVAEGVYVPTSDTTRESTFQLPIGVQLFGGFAGNELTLTARNIDVNPSILSGDIGIPGNKADNVYHVVTIIGGNAQTICDGFTITEGNANVLNSDVAGAGGGILVLANDAYPIAAPIVQNCLFEKNNAQRGGGMACYGFDSFNSVPEVKNCKFLRNSAAILGAGMYKQGLNPPLKMFHIENCVFERNRSLQNAGGIAVSQSSGTTRFTNCIFVKDSARFGAGAMYFETGNQSVRYELTECFLNGNYAPYGCGGLAHDDLGSPDSIVITVKGSRFTGNSNFLSNGGAFFSFAGSKYHGVDIQRSLFDSNYSYNQNAGIYVEYTSNTFGDLNISRCTFLDNSLGVTGISGGAIYSRGFGSGFMRIRNVITNCDFLHNDGAIETTATFPSETRTIIANCSFRENGNHPFSKWQTIENQDGKRINTMEILNCVIWEPQVSEAVDMFYNNATIPTIQGYTIDHSLINLDSCVYNGANIAGSNMIYNQWPEFFDPIFGSRLLLEPSSVARNRGSNIVADTLGLTLDRDLRPRICEGAVDMGAYEIIFNCTSGTGSPTASQPFDCQLLQNPISQFQRPAIRVFAESPAAFMWQVMDATGKVQSAGSFEYSGNEWVNEPLPFQPASPGVYFIQIQDKKGRQQWLKLLVE